MNEKRSEYRFWLLFTQLGVTVVSPIVAFVLLALLLDHCFTIPDWLMVILILLGIATGVSGAFKQLWTIAKKEEKKGERLDE